MEDKEGRKEGEQGGNGVEIIQCFSNFMPPHILELILASPVLTSPVLREGGQAGDALSKGKEAMSSEWPAHPCSPQNRPGLQHVLTECGLSVKIIR